MSTLAAAPGPLDRDFSLSEFIQRTLDESDSTNLDELVEQVARTIPPEFVPHALRQGIRRIMGNRIRAARYRRRGEVGSTQSSPKVTAIRRSWEHHLEDLIYVGTVSRKRLADCTYDNLMFAAMERQKMAQGNAAWAKVFASWAQDVKAAGVSTFGGLHHDVQRRAIERIPPR